MLLGNDARSPSKSLSPWWKAVRNATDTVFLRSECFRGCGKENSWTNRDRDVLILDTARCISSTWESVNNEWQDPRHSSWHPFGHNTVSIATFFSAIALFPVGASPKKGQSKNEAVGWRIHSLASAYGKRQKHRYFRTMGAEADLAYPCAWTQRWKAGDHACKTQLCIHLESIRIVPEHFQDNVLLRIEMRRFFELDNSWWHHHLPAM